MTQPLRCSEIEDRLREEAEGTSSDDVRAHLDACGACARLERRERRLIAMLRSLPEGRQVRLPPLKLPDAPVRRIRFPRWAAVAAAVLVTLAIASQWAGHGRSGVRIDRVIDVAEAPPQVDDRLLALTGGFEAVAMRRPTESR